MLVDATIDIIKHHTLIATGYIIMIIVWLPSYALTVYTRVEWRCL